MTSFRAGKGTNASLMETELQHVSARRGVETNPNLSQCIPDRGKTSQSSRSPRRKNPLTKRLINRRLYPYIQCQ